MKTRLLLSAALVVNLAACAPQKAGSIQEVMTRIIDPSADALWSSITSTVTAQGETGRQPTTDEDWKTVRGHALQVIEGARLLQRHLPVVADPEARLDDAGAPGARNAGQIAADIKVDPKRFHASAAALETSAREALEAIERKDIQALILAGDSLDQACESCHAAYWHPRNPYVPMPSAEDFGKIAIKP